MSHVKLLRSRGVLRTAHNTRLLSHRDRALTLSATPAEFGSRSNVAWQQTGTCKQWLHGSDLLVCGGCTLLVGVSTPWLVYDV